jgi:hypothetical protein
MNKAISLLTVTKFIKYDNYVLKNNQNAIITYLLANDCNGGLIVTFKAAQFKLALKNEVKSNRTHYDTKRCRHMIVTSPIICYYVAFLDLLTDCGEGKNAFTENFGQSLISMKDITNMLNIEYLPLNFRLSLIKFLFHVYLDIEKDMPFTMQEILVVMADLMLSEYNTSLDMLTQNKSGVCTEEGDPIAMKDADLLTHRDLVRMDQLMFDYLDILLECFVVIVTKSLKVDKGTPAWESFKKVH